MRYYCSICKQTITSAEYKYSMEHYNKALCMEHQKKKIYKKPSKKKSYLSGSEKTTFYKKSSASKVTPQARKLYNALRKRGIRCKLEAYDGYKDVDISISWASLNIEIDGRHHLLNSKQLYADLERDYYSQEDNDVRTIRITNAEIDRDVNRIANSIVKVAKRKYREEDDFW